MKWYMAMLYGLIQGLAEFLPISSSGHLALFQSFGLGSTDSLFTFNILLHIGTLLAVFAVFYADIFPLVPAFFRIVKKLFTGKLWVRQPISQGEGSESEASPKKGKLCLNADGWEKMVIMVIVATLPLVSMVFLKDYVELISSYPKIIGGILIFNGVMLFVSDRIGKGTKELASAGLLDALTVGICQTFAVLPGLSRSGSTITSGLIRGFERPFAVKFSFILSIPAILGAAVLEIPDVIAEPIASADIFPYVLGMVTSAVVGFAAMKLLLYISKKSNFTVFAFYCWIVGAITVIFAG